MKISCITVTYTHCITYIMYCFKRDCFALQGSIHCSAKSEENCWNGCHEAELHGVEGQQVEGERPDLDWCFMDWPKTAWQQNHRVGCIERPRQQNFRSTLGAINAASQIVLKVGPVWQFRRHSLVFGEIKETRSMPIHAKKAWQSFLPVPR